MLKIGKLRILLLVFLLAALTAGLVRTASPAEREIADLLCLSDARLLETIQHRAFDFFWREANPENGLIRDRSTPDSPCSIASTGFGLAAIPVGIEAGWITKKQGYDRVLTTLRSFADGKVEGTNGFFCHWVDRETGRGVWDREVSSIDSSLFIAGALAAGGYFKGTEAEKLADRLYQAMDWQWMMNGGGPRDNPSMGWLVDKKEFLPYRWNDFNEGLLLTILGLGSPTHPLPATAWDGISRMIRRKAGGNPYVYLPSETLFVYIHPYCFIDFRDKEDRFANYWNNSIEAARNNRGFCVANRAKFQTYEGGVWGLSASDGPDGYRAYGASDGNHDGTIAPYASVACVPYLPELALANIRLMLKKHGALIWGKYGFVSAFNVDRNWYSGEYIGLDQGDTVLMLANYRSGLIWRCLMGSRYIQEAMRKAGFVEKKADYAVTPAYANR